MFMEKGFQPIVFKSAFFYVIACFFLNKGLGMIMSMYGWNPNGFHDVKQDFGMNHGSSESIPIYCVKTLQDKHLQKRWNLRASWLYEFVFFQNHRQVETDCNC